jgi:hypothetical protein
VEVNAVQTIDSAFQMFVSRVEVHANGEGVAR